MNSQSLSGRDLLAINSICLCLCVTFEHDMTSHDIYFSFLYQVVLTVIENRYPRHSRLLHRKVDSHNSA